MKIGNIFGIDIIINKYLIIILALFFFTNYFEDIIVLIIIIFLHDFCHLIVAKAFNVSITELELMPFGGIAKIESVIEIRPTAEICIAIAGPMFNLLLAMISFFVNCYIGKAIWNINEFITYNLMLAGFNLLPALPLDGGRIFRSILSQTIGIKRATIIAARFGKALSIILLAASIYGLVYQVFNPTVVMVSVFLLISSFKEEESSNYLFIKDITTKKDKLMNDGVLKVKHLIVSYDVPVKEIIKKFIPEKYHIIYVVDQKGNIISELTESDIVDLMMEYGSEVKISKKLSARSNHSIG